MATKLRRIAMRSKSDPKAEFKWLMPLYTEENLKRCFNELDGNKAVGIDGRTKADYAKDLDANIRDLRRRMVSLNYRPSPVREVLIPKANGKFRPLAISNIEDKIVQLMTNKILDAIYDPIFSERSYGFRRGKSAHMAIAETREHLRDASVKVVIDIDLANFFGTINQKDLMKMLALKIKDERFLRYIARMLKAGTQTKEGIRRSEDGVLQGSVASPCLANIYAHYVIDLWFERVVPKHIKGNVVIYRYCDDMIACCTTAEDVDKIIRSFEKRLAKFGLKLNLEKTKTVKFNKWAYWKGEKQGTFGFLGFTFYFAKTKKGNATVKLRTNHKTLRAKLQVLKQWLKENRSKGTLLVVWRKYLLKLKGHLVYFGVSDNSPSLKRYLHAARDLFFKWMNRRSHKRSFSWERFVEFERQYPMPIEKIYHRFY